MAKQVNTKRLLSKVKIEQINDTCHKVYVDGEEVHHVSGLTVNIDPMSIPTVEITLNSAADIDGMAFVKYNFSSESLKECMKYIFLHIQFDEPFRAALLLTIDQALRDAKDNGFEDDRIAEFILERIIR